MKTVTYLLRGTTTEFYPYRKACARNIFLELLRTHETTKYFEESLCNNINSREGYLVHPDNHTTFAIRTENGTMIYITCSDSAYYIGTEIEIGDW